MLCMVMSAFSITVLADKHDGDSFEDRKSPRLPKFVEDVSSEGLTDEETEELLAAIKERQDERLENMKEKAEEHEEELREKLADEGLSEDEIDEKVERRMNEARKKIGHRIRQFSNAKVNVEDLSDEKIEKLKQLRREQLKDVLGQEDPEQAKAQLAKFREKKIDLAKRDIPEEARGQAKERFGQARDRFNEVDGETKEKRDAFHDARDALKACEDDCEDEEAEVLAKAIEHVVNSGEKVVSHIDKVVAKIEGNENIDEERAGDILEKLATAKSEVEAAIADAKAATTKEELRAAAKEIHTIWSKVKHTAQAATARHINGRIHGLIKRSEVLEKKFDRVISAIEDNGIEIADLDAKAEEFSTHISTAQDFYGQSEAKLDEAKELKDADGETDAIKALVAEAKELGKQSHDALKKAHEIVVELVKEIKSADTAADLSTLPSDEVELVA